LNGSDASGGINKAGIIIIKGKYFGIKAPAVSLEYIDAKGAVKFKRLKVQRVYHYADAKGNAQKGCMNIETGESQIRIKIPDKNLNPGNYSLVLDNKTGIALDARTGTLPIITIIK
ncbi:MAG: hypothetical protein L3J71_15690, partial [Victivallaceae bacterium]|nr:hypothetical protein [Victivallaceae bacterium]